MNYHRMKYLSKNLIHVCGINRSGQHAISALLLGTCHKAIYKNNTGKDKTGNAQFALDKRFKHSGSNYQLFVDGKRNREYGINMITDQMPVDLFIIGSENVTPKGLKNGQRAFIKNSNALLKKIGSDRMSENEKIVFVIRSPWNHIASSMFWRGKNHFVNNPEKFVPAWNAIAQETLRMTNYLPKNKFVPILFDKWYDDIEYRKQLCKLLNMDFNDKNKNVILGYGKGSTFQRTNNGQKLNIKNRWEKCLRNETHTKKLIDMLTYDPQTLEMSEKLFGELPEGIKALL